MRSWLRRNHAEYEGRALPDGRLEKGVSAVSRKLLKEGAAEAALYSKLPVLDIYSLLTVTPFRVGSALLH